MKTMKRCLKLQTCSNHKGRSIKGLGPVINTTLSSLMSKKTWPIPNSICRSVNKNKNSDSNFHAPSLMVRPKGVHELNANPD